MNWKQEDGYITTGDALKASVRRRLDKYVVRVGGLSAHWTCDTEEEAKRFGEEQLQIAKRAVIMSMIKKAYNDKYTFGYVDEIGHLFEITGGHYGLDEWTVCQGEVDVYEGTLEECKNYIVECF